MLELRRDDAAVARMLTARVAVLLTVTPLMWAGNALVGRLYAGVVPPLLLNALRWSGALLILLLLGWRVLATAPRRAEIGTRWRELSVLGLLGVGAYNALQYLALQTSTPINVTLIAASTPIWMLLIGALFYGERIHATRGLGALLSFAGVLVVLARGDLATLAAIELVPGDLWMMLAALAWAVYSWQLSRPPARMRGDARPRWNWAEFVLVQVLFGLIWAGAAAAGEAAVVGTRALPWSPGFVAALVFLAVGPSVLAYRFWAQGVAAVGPAAAGFFGNLTPLFAALLSALVLREPPHGYHGLAFALIVAGIAVGNLRSAARTRS